MGTNSKGNRKYIQIEYYNAQKDCKLYLDNLIDGVNDVSNKLVRFCASSKDMLLGKAFDIMRERLIAYSNVFIYMESALEVLKNNIESSNNNVCNIMGGHTEISDLNIDEIESKINDSRSLIYKTKNDLDVLDIEEKEKNNELLKQCNDTILTLTSEKTKLETLIDSVAAADSSGLASIDDVATKMQTLKSKMMY